MRVFSKVFLTIFVMGSLPSACSEEQFGRDENSVTNDSSDQNNGYTEFGSDGNPDSDADSDSDSDSDGDADSDIDADTDVDADADADADADSDADAIVIFDSEEAEVCDARSIDIEPEPGRLMFLLDMSMSMLEGEPRKLDQAVAAITDVITSFSGKGIEFGLDVFPDGSMDPKGQTRCGVNNEVVVDCEMNTETTIIEELNRPRTYGATPIYCAMENFKDDTYAPKYSSMKGSNVLIVVTDGKDNCFTDCQENTQLSSNREFGKLSAELCDSHGIKTVTIGFGEEADEGQLNAIAENGCTEYTEYFKVNNKAELLDALQLLAGLAIGCTFSIGTLDDEVDPDLVNVYFDNETVKYDQNCSAKTGWTWTSDAHSKLEFCEKACKDLNSGDVDSVSAKFGCKTIPII
jgi:hypothetical protein